MLQVPSRISQLIELVELNADTPEQLRKIARLQALDIAKAGEDFVARAVATEEKKTEEFRQAMEAL